MNTNLQQKAHPLWVAPSDLDLNELERLGFIDQSYCNDACPLFENRERRLALFVDYPPELSDWQGEFPRYSFNYINRHGEWLADLLSTNDFEEVLNFVR